MRLNPIAFNAWLSGNIGQNVNWRKGNPCPCFNPQSGAALPGHALCGGKGWIWDPPIEAKAGISQEKVKREWAQMGQWEAGDSILTIPSDSAMYGVAGRFDRIELLNSTDIFKLTLIRGTRDRIFLPVVSFAKVFWLDPQNNQVIVNGGLPAIDALGNLTWPNNDGPPSGSQYSVMGTRYTDYYIWADLPSNRNEHFGAALPKKLMARRFDLFGR